VHDEYAVDVGLRVKKFDVEVLKYSRRKAEADILTTEARIRELELDLAAEIRELKGEAESKRLQLQSLHASRASRQEVYAFKQRQYLAGEEKVDNLLQSFRSLVETEERYYRAGNDYFDNIRDLDDLCGLYFEKLGMVVE
jgi:outer membrane protein TolC